MRKLRWMALTLAVAAWGADKTPPWERPQARVQWGEDLYREHCAVCHDVEQDQKKTRKLGPSLNRLFKNEKLPLTGGKPSREYVEVKVKFGGQLMPPFIKKMNDAEIAALVAFLETK